MCVHNVAGLHKKWQRYALVRKNHVKKIQSLASYTHIHIHISKPPNKPKTIPVTHSTYYWWYAFHFATVGLVLSDRSHRVPSSNTNVLSKEENKNTLKVCSHPTNKNKKDADNCKQFGLAVYAVWCVCCGCGVFSCCANCLCSFLFIFFDCFNCFSCFNGGVCVHLRDTYKPKPSIPVDLFSIIFEIVSLCHKSIIRW